MINLNFNLYNPWSQAWDTVWTKSRLISKHKVVEFNGYRTNQIIKVDLQLKPRGDHAGVRIMLGLLGNSVELHFYDTRHWDYETGTWKVHL